MRDRIRDEEAFARNARAEARWLAITAALSLSPTLRRRWLWLCLLVCIANAVLTGLWILDVMVRSQSNTWAPYSPFAHLFILGFWGVGLRMIWTWVKARFLAWVGRTIEADYEADELFE